MLFKLVPTKKYKTIEEYRKSLKDLGVAVAARYTRGNIAIQNGSFQTQEDHEKNATRFHFNMNKRNKKST